MDTSDSGLPPHAAEWVKAEFDQSYEHLRDRDERIIDLTKFYATLVCSIGAACGGLLSLTTLPHPYGVVGIVLLAAALMGGLVLIWLVAFRRYFVDTARQLNALRGVYTRGIGEPMRGQAVVHRTDGSHPPYWRVSSAHVAALLLVALINSCLAALAVAAIVFDLELTGWPTVGLPLAAFVVSAVASTLYFRATLGGK